MQKSMLAVTTAVLIGTSSPVLGQGIPVFDATRAADFIQQFENLTAQLDTARSQLEEAQRMYESVTGTRGLGDIWRNPELREFLPPELENLYDTVNSGDLQGISGSVEDILAAEELDTSDGDYHRQLSERSRRAAATGRAVGQRAYEGAQQRLNQIEQLMDEISQTEDQKAIEELQARIAGEQAAIENEMTKLQIISQVQEAEYALIEEQRREMNQRLLSSDRSEIPGFD